MDLKQRPKRGTFMCSKSILNDLLSEVAQYAQEYFGSSLDAVILYGSYARGDADDESDVDIMLLIKRSAEELAAQRKVWTKFGTALDLKYNVFTSFRLQDADTFYSWKDVMPFFNNIIKEGVRIRV